MAVAAAAAAKRTAIILHELLLIKASVDTYLHHSDGNRQVMLGSNLSPLTTSGGGKFKLRVRVRPPPPPPLPPPPLSRGRPPAVRGNLTVRC